MDELSFYAYMLSCRDGSYYVGQTDNLELRLYQHIAGSFPGYTRGRRPLRLVWSESFGSREEAFAAERRIKGWSRAKKEALVAGDWGTISALAAVRNADREIDHPAAHPSSASG